MGKYSPLFKHNILIQYTPNQRGNGFDSLASHYKIQGGGRTIKNWYDRWNGIVTSLEHRHGAGRPALLNTKQIKQHIGTPIRAKNRKHIKIHYPTIQKTIQSKLNKSISIRSIRRYGKEQGTKIKRTKKVTNKERKYTYIIQMESKNVCSCKYILTKNIDFFLQFFSFHTTL